MVRRKKLCPRSKASKILSAPEASLVTKHRGSRPALSAILIIESASRNREKKKCVRNRANRFPRETAASISLALRKRKKA
jgi:hypothetical protein